MTTLKEVCYEKFAKSVENAPPLVQEMIIGETRSRIKDKINQELKQKVTDETKKEVKNNFCNVLPYLIPEIMQDIINSISHAGRTHHNFYEKYKHLDVEIIDCAIKSAENAVNKMEEYYIHRAFNIANASTNNIDDSYYGTLYEVSSDDDY